MGAPASTRVPMRAQGTQKSPPGGRTSRQWRPMRPPRGLFRVSRHSSRRIRDASQHEPRKRHEGPAAPADPAGRREGAGAARGRALIPNEGPEHQKPRRRARAARHGLAAVGLVESCWRRCAVAAGIPLGTGCGVGHGAARCCCWAGAARLRPASPTAPWRAPGFELSCRLRAKWRSAAAGFRTAPFGSQWTLPTGLISHPKFRFC